jgi:hypothetical protein
MTDSEFETLEKQMWALAQSSQSDPVLKALAHLICQQIDGLRRNPSDIDLRKMMMRMLREIHNAIGQQRRPRQRSA